MGFAVRRKKRELLRAAPGLAAAREMLDAPGRELDASTRAAMEPRFGRDFSQVRVHTGAEAAASARALHAEAYTVGRHVVFDEGKFAPQTKRGQQLLSHELTHTIQQDQAATASSPLKLGSSQDSGEKEAQAVMAGNGPVAVHSRQAVGIQRQPDLSSPHFDLAESASPMMARTIGSVTIDGFETGKSEISKGNQAELAKTGRSIQTLLNKYPGSTIRIIGHTDAVGKEDNNMTLGQARADSVQAALVALGIPVEAIQTQSMGETQLLVKTQRPEARNRRVEVRFEPNSHQFANFLPDVSLKPPTPPGASGGFGFKPNLNLPPEYSISPGSVFSPRTPPGSPSFDPIPGLPPAKNTPIKNPIESFAESITSSLPKSIRGIAKDLVIGAISKGVTTGLDAGLERAGVDQKSRDAIGTAVEATIKLKSGGAK